MWNRNVYLGISGFFLLVAVVLEIASASQYPKQPIKSSDLKRDLTRMENVSRLHNLSLILVIGAIALGLHASVAPAAAASASALSSF